MTVNKDHAPYAIKSWLEPANNVGGDFITFPDAKSLKNHLRGLVDRWGTWATCNLVHIYKLSYWSDHFDYRQVDIKIDLSNDNDF